MNILNFVLERIVMPLGDLVIGSTVMKDLKKWRKVVSLSEAEIDIYSETKLLKLLKFATKNIPYYKKFGEFSDDNPYLWIKQFPIMNKSIIKENIDISDFK